MERDELGQIKTKRQRENDIHKLWPTDGQKRKMKQREGSFEKRTEHERDRQRRRRRTDREIEDWKRPETERLDKAIKKRHTQWDIWTESYTGGKRRTATGGDEQRQSEINREREVDKMPCLYLCIEQKCMDIAVPERPIVNSKWPYVCNSWLNLCTCVRVELHLLCVHHGLTAGLHFKITL